MLTATACSSGTGSPAPARTVDVLVKDVRFDPTTLTVEHGETVTFRLTNRDAIAHDAFVGDAAAQAAHEREMRSSAGAHAHSASTVTVEPGKTVTLTHTFGTPGTVEIACHVEGHYASGMKMTVTVR